MSRGNWSDWTQIGTAKDFIVARVQKWNCMAQYRLQLNSDF